MCVNSSHVLKLPRSAPHGVSISHIAYNESLRSPLHVWRLADVREDLGHDHMFTHSSTSLLDFRVYTPTLLLCLEKFGTSQSQFLVFDNDPQ